MGAAPSSARGKVTLLDTAENLSVGLKAFSLGQLSSFNEIQISDSGDLVLDPVTFANLDKATQTASWSSHNGTSLTRQDPNPAYINLRGTLDQVEPADLSPIFVHNLSCK